MRVLVTGATGFLGRHIVDALDASGHEVRALARGTSRTEHLEAKGVGDGVLDLGAKETTEVMQAIKNLRTTIRVVGPTADPRLVFDVDGLTKQFQQALLDAGKQRLGNEIDKQIEKNLGDAVPQELQDALKKPGKDLIEGLGGLLGGGKKEGE